MITLVFSGFSLILHLAHHIAKFRRSCCKRFAAKCTFKLKAHCTVSSVTEVSFFTGREAPENWGDQVFFLGSKGGIKRFFQIKKGDHLYFLKK